MNNVVKNSKTSPKKSVTAKQQAKSNLTKRKNPDWDNLDRGYRYLTQDMKLPHDQAVAVMGNVVEESQGDYKAVQKNGGGRGLIQWDGKKVPSGRYSQWGSIWASVAKPANVYDSTTDTVKNYWAPWGGLKGDKVRQKFIKAPIKEKARIYAESYLRPGKPRIADRQLSAMQLDSIYNPRIKDIIVQKNGGQIRKMQTAAGGPLNLSPEDIKKGANLIGEYFLKGLGAFGKIATAPFRSQGPTSATIYKSKEQLAKERTIENKSEEQLGKAMTWVSPLNYGTALATGNGLNARKGEEEVASWSPAWQAVGRLGELYAGPKVVKGVKAAPRVVVNTAAKAGVKPAKAAVVAREIKQATKNKPKYTRVPSKDLFRTQVYKGGEITDPYSNFVTTDPQYAANYGKVTPYIFESRSVAKAKEPMMGSSDPVTMDMFIYNNTKRNPNATAIIGHDAATGEFAPSKGTEILNMNPKNLYPIRTSDSPTSLKFFERKSSKISEAEKAGVPKGERNNVNNSGNLERTVNDIILENGYSLPKETGMFAQKHSSIGSSYRKTFEKLWGKENTDRLTDDQLGKLILIRNHQIDTNIPQKGDFVYVVDGQAKAYRNGQEIGYLNNSYIDNGRALHPEMVKKQGTNNAGVSELLYNGTILAENRPIISGSRLLMPEVTTHIWTKYPTRKLISTEGVHAWPLRTAQERGIKLNYEKNWHTQPEFSKQHQQALDENIRTNLTGQPIYELSEPSYLPIVKNARVFDISQLRNGYINMDFTPGFAYKQGGKMNILEFLKNGSGIHIKKENRGKFTSYCGGKVTNECIQKGKNSSNPAIRKRATFADNARHFKHRSGGELIKKAQLGTQLPIAEDAAQRYKNGEFIKKFQDNNEGHAVIQGVMTNKPFHNQGSIVRKINYRMGIPVDTTYIETPPSFLPVKKTARVATRYSDWKNNMYAGNQKDLYNTLKNRWEKANQVMRRKDGGILKAQYGAPLNISSEDVQGGLRFLNNGLNKVLGVLNTPVAGQNPTQATLPNGSQITIPGVQGGAPDILPGKIGGAKKLQSVAKIKDKGLTVTKQLDSAVRHDMVNIDQDLRHYGFKTKRISPEELIDKMKKYGEFRGYSDHLTKRLNNLKRDNKQSMKDFKALKNKYEDMFNDFLHNGVKKHQEGAKLTSGQKLGNFANSALGKSVISNGLSFLSDKLFNKSASSNQEIAQAAQEKEQPTIDPIQVAQMIEIARNQYADPDNPNANGGDIFNSYIKNQITAPILARQQGEHKKRLAAIDQQKNQAKSSAVGTFFNTLAQGGIEYLQNKYGTTEKADS